MRAKSIGVLAVPLFLALGAAPGHAADGQKALVNPLRIIGSWRATTFSPFIPKLPPIFMTFGVDGNLVETDIGALVEVPALGFGLFVTGHGEWEVRGPNTIKFTYHKHLFEPEGVVQVGQTRSVGTITLSPDGKSFTAEVSLEFRDPDDHLLVALPAHFDGKRISLRQDEADQAAGRD